MTTSSAFDAKPSSTTYWMTGRSTTSSISFGCAFVAGRKRVPKPAAGISAFIGNLSSRGNIQGKRPLGAFWKLTGQIVARGNCAARDVGERDPKATKPKRGPARSPALEEGKRAGN